MWSPNSSPYPIDLHALLPWLTFSVLCPLPSMRSENHKAISIWEEKSVCSTYVESPCSFPTGNYNHVFKWQINDNHLQKSPVRYKGHRQKSVSVNKIDCNNMSTYVSGHHTERPAFHLFSFEDPWGQCLLMPFAQFLSRKHVFWWLRGFKCNLRHPSIIWYTMFKYLFWLYSCSLVLMPYNSVANMVFFYVCF